MFLLVLIGIVLGSIIFTFTLIISKKNEKYYLAPIITFMMAIACTAYGLFIVGGFEGMAYGILAVGFLIVSILGTLLLPIFVRKKSTQNYNRWQKVSLVILPTLFLLTIGIMFYSDKGYWIIDKGKTSGEKEGYRVSTISEGKKEVLLMLGEEYLGKEVEVKKVRKQGPTEIILEIIEGEVDNQAPYIRIGLDEIKEPLKIQTIEGTTFESLKAVKDN